MVQLADVARVAGVSTASVSRVLNHPDKVSREIRERVRAAMEQLGYVRDGAARALASRRSFTIGAIVPTIGLGIFAKGIEAMQRSLEPKGYHLLVASTHYDEEQELVQVRALLERGIDGLALVGHRHAEQIYQLLASRSVAYVNTYQFDPDNPHPCIGFDNFKAAYRLARYLVDLGHRAFGIVTSPTAVNDRIEARLAGILACLRDNGIEAPEGRIVEVAHNLAEGRLGASTLLRRHPEVTAICCTADVLALGTLFECRELGYRVPEQMSVSGFDDIDIVGYLDPALTTVHVPVETIGGKVADYLLARIEGRAVPQKVELAAEVMVRRSTGRPRATDRPDR